MGAVPRTQDVMLLRPYSGTPKPNSIPPFIYRCLEKYIFYKMCRTILTKTTDRQRLLGNSR